MYTRTVLGETEPLAASSLTEAIKECLDKMPPSDWSRSDWCIYCNNRLAAACRPPSVIPSVGCYYNVDVVRWDVWDSDATPAVRRYSVYPVFTLTGAYSHVEVRDIARLY